MRDRIIFFIKTNLRLIFFGIAILIFLLSVSSFLIKSVDSRFSELERTRNIEHAKGVVLVINSYAENLSNLLAGWAYWEESSLYLNGKRPDYFKVNFTSPVMKQTGIDAVVFYDLKDQYVNSRRITTDRSGSEKMPQSVIMAISTALSLLKPVEIDGVVWGLLNTDQGVMIISCRHVSDDNIARPSQGYILFGRLLGISELNNISNILGNKLSWKNEGAYDYSRVEGTLSTKAFGSLKVYRTNQSPVTSEDDILCILINFPDIQNESSLNLNITVPSTYREQIASTAALIKIMYITTAALISIFVFYLISEIHRRHKAEQNLKESLKFERSIRQLSQLFINLPENNLDQAINESLSILSGYVSGDFGYIFEFTDHLKSFKKTHQWHSERYTPKLAFNELVPAAGIEKFIEKITDNEMVILDFPDAPDVSTKWSTYIYYQLQLATCLNVPMKEGSQLIGFIGFASMEPHRQWTEDEKRLLTVFSEILTIYIQRKRAQIKIRDSEKTLMESALKESELKSLKSQINPHFLFNSLNSLRALIDENPGRAREAVTLLSSLLRAALRSGHTELISLEEEMVVIRAFLCLEEIRFEERLKVFIHIPEECRKAQVPPMLIQTLVENAVKFGIEPYQHGGLISLKANLNNKKLHFTVENTGQLVPSSDSIRIGLNNAQERIRLLFGNEGELHVYNSSSTTVTAEIILPSVP